MRRIIIIGGGAAGFFCAANLDENLYKITILEQNSDVLQKVKISGEVDVMLLTPVSIRESSFSSIRGGIKNC